MRQFNGYVLKLISRFCLSNRQQKDPESDSLLHDESGSRTLNDDDVPKPAAWKSDKDFRA